MEAARWLLCAWWVLSGAARALCLMAEVWSAPETSGQQPVNWSIDAPGMMLLHIWWQSMSKASAKGLPDPISSVWSWRLGSVGRVSPTARISSAQITGHLSSLLNFFNWFWVPVVQSQKGLRESILFVISLEGERFGEGRQNSWVCCRSNTNCRRPSRTVL